MTDTAFTRSLATLAASLPRPEAILVVSAHRLTGDTRVLTAAAPRTIHDFGGLPRALYEIQHPAPRASEYVTRVGELLPEASPAATSSTGSPG